MRAQARPSTQEPGEHTIFAANERQDAPAIRNKRATSWCREGRREGKEEEWEGVERVNRV